MIHRKIIANRKTIITVNCPVPTLDCNCVKIADGKDITILREVCCNDFIDPNQSGQEVHLSIKGSDKKKRQVVACIKQTCFDCQYRQK